MLLKIGDIYWLTVIYRNSEEETRPVVIYDFDDDSPVVASASFATITGSGIKNFNGRYDKWKSPIFKWKEAGLFKPSYIKTNNISVIDVGTFKETDFIGRLSHDDLKNALILIDKFIDSGEDYW